MQSLFINTVFNTLFNWILTAASLTDEVLYILTDANFITIFIISNKN